MGADVWHECGIIASIDDMIQLIRPQDLKTLISICDSESLERLELSEFDHLNTITKNSTIEEVRNALRECVTVHGKPSKYGNDDCYIDDAEGLTFLWAEIISQTRPELPSLIDVTIFDSGRYSGGEVPLGEPCFIFDCTECFIQTLSDRGNALRDALGSCERSDWTIYSI